MKSPGIEFWFKYPIAGLPGQFSKMHDVQPPNTPWKDVLKEWPAGAIKINKRWASYAWPGGYPLFYVTADNGVLCPKCANKNLTLTLKGDDQWRIVTCDINYEDNSLYCDNCSGKIQSSYGEDERM